MVFPPQHTAPGHLCMIPICRWNVKPALHPRDTTPTNGVPSSPKNLVCRRGDLSATMLALFPDGCSRGYGRRASMTVSGGLDLTLPQQ